MPPTDEGIGEALRAAQDAWPDWQRDVDVDFASPDRAARDIVHAAEVARRGSATADEW